MPLSPEKFPKTSVATNLSQSSCQTAETSNATKADEDSLLRAAAMALDIAQGDVEENLRRVDVMLGHLPQDVDVAVLPELFTSSFMRDTDALKASAQSVDSQTMRFLKDKAAKHNILLAGSFLAKEGDADASDLKGEDYVRYYNRGFMVLPDGTTTFYDKRHLFCLSEESHLVTHGQTLPPIISFRGWNITMIICYDLRFPVWSRSSHVQADMMLVPANWPTARGYAWRTLLCARAIENQVVMVGADRSGSDDFGHYDGLAMIADELGRQVSPPLAAPVEGIKPPTLHHEEIATPYGPILIATASKNALHRLRQYLPTHCDADSFTIHKFKQ